MLENVEMFFVAR